MDPSELECGVCSNAFSDDHCPMILPCSHTFCECCIDSIISTQRRACPVCREDFAVTSAQGLTINRIALNMAKQRSKGPRTPSSRPNESLQEMINDFREKIVKKSVNDFQSAESQLSEVLETCDELKEGFLKTSKDIDRVIKELQEVKLSRENNWTIFMESIEMLRENLILVQQGKEKIQGLNAKLDKAEDFTSVGVIMDEVGEVLQDRRETLKDLDKHLQQHEEKRHGLEKEMVNAEIWMNSIFEEATKTLDTCSWVNLLNRDLQSSSDATEGSAQKEIYVVKKSLMQKQRVALVKKGPKFRYYASHLVRGPVPRNCFVIKVGNLMEMPFRRVFLDLSVKDTLLGRIIIKVMDEGNLALNFLHLCAGDLGLSYANSVMHVFGEGKDGERLTLREYETEEGTSSNGLLWWVDWNREKKRDIYKETSVKAGQVRGQWFIHRYASQFNIVTKDSPGESNKYCFGMVEEGLDIVREAITLSSCIRIIDCGLVFSL